MDETALDERSFARIAGLMHETIGLALTTNKHSLVYTRLAPRLQRLGIDDFDTYAGLIESAEDGGEFQVAVDLLTTNETYFFREPAHFALLERELARQRPKQTRVWSAAASFGDEAYSVAMLLADMSQMGRVGSDWSVLGTDISDRVLQSAARGVFPAERLRDVSEERLRRYALRGEGESEGLVQMQDRLRERVQFAQLNLCADLPEIGPFDVVMLRNVLIYFDNATKREVVDRVLTQLRPGGLFFVGTAEGRVASSTPLKVLAPGAFRREAP